MKKEEEILNTGIFFWFKSQRRGKVAVELQYLTDEQKITLSSGLTQGKYELCNPYQDFTSHYMWFDNNKGRYFLVTDVEIPLVIRRKISPAKPTVESFPYQVTLSDMTRLLNDFKAGVIDEIYIERFLSIKPWNPWGNKEWKSKRDPIIKGSCKYCGSQLNLVLQHTKQPRKIKSILYELVGERYADFQVFIEQNKNDIELSFSENIPKVPICPKCGSSQVHLRIRGKNMGTYVCNKGKNYEVCKNTFVNPDYGYDEKAITQTRKTALRDKFCKNERLLRLAVEICLEEIIEYLNLTETITLCNRCAYKEDRPFDKYYDIN